MAVGTEVVAVRYEDIEAGTPISVPYPLYEALDIQVYYGFAAQLAVYNTDYTITLGEDFDTFTLTPTAALRAKIDALIVADPANEENYITVRRRLDYLTDSTAAAVRYTPFTSREFERTVLRFQQIQEQLNRCIALTPNFVGDSAQLQISELQPDRVLMADPTGQTVIAGPTVGEIEAAQQYAEDAAQALADAAIAAANAAQAAQDAEDAGVTAVANIATAQTSATDAITVAQGNATDAVADAQATAEIALGGYVSAAQDAAEEAQGYANQIALPTAIADTMLVRNSDNNAYEALTRPQTRRFLGVAGNTINYFDFVPRNKIAGISAGTDTDDQAAYWQAFRDALQAEATAGRKPHGVIPQCTIYTSVCPNFAIPGLQLDTLGLPKIISTSANPGFKMDGTDLGVGGWGLFGLRVGALMAGTTTGANGIEIKYIHQSHFEPLYTLGGTVAGIWISFCVSTTFDTPACSLSYLNGGAFLATPVYGIVLTAVTGDPKGTASGWCTLINPIGEHVPTGILLDKAQGTTLICGVAESCTDIGLVLGAAAIYTNVVGTDFESNTTYDVFCEAPYCTFTGIKAEHKFALWGLAKGCLVSGGVFGSIICDVNTKRNTFRDLLYATTAGENITDNGTDKSNRFINCTNHQTEKQFSEWRTSASLAATHTGGGGATITANGNFFTDGRTVHFTVEITVSVVGTASGAIVVTLPHAASRYFAFSGVEIGHGADAVAATLATSSNQLYVRKWDGSYPGDEAGNVIIISGTYERA